MDELTCKKCGRILLPESVRCVHCQTESDLPVPTELRCECGFLLGKLTEDAIEIKCRRCKRLVYIPYNDIPGRIQDIKAQQKNGVPSPRSFDRASAAKKNICSVCGKKKPNILYGKCVECRTESIKVQYRSRIK